MTFVKHHDKPTESWVVEATSMNTTFLYGFYTKIVTDYPLVCVAVVVLSLVILLLCFITFIVFYCPVAFVNF